MVSTVGVGVVVVLAPPDVIGADGVVVTGVLSFLLFPLLLLSVVLEETVV